MLMKVKENSDLVRDSETMAILTNNIGVVAAHKKKISEIKEKEQQKEEINMLKKDVSEIKDLLQQIIQRL